MKNKLAIVLGCALAAACTLNAEPKDRHHRGGRTVVRPAARPAAHHARPAVHHSRPVHHRNVRHPANARHWARPHYAPPRRHGALRDWIWIDAAWNMLIDGQYYDGDGYFFDGYNYYYNGAYYTTAPTMAVVTEPAVVTPTVVTPAPAVVTNGVYHVRAVENADKVVPIGVSIKTPNQEENPQ